MAFQHMLPASRRIGAAPLSALLIAAALALGAAPAAAQPGPSAGAPAASPSSAPWGASFSQSWTPWGPSGVGLRTAHAFMSACGADLAQHCRGVRAGGGRLISCLSENAASLEPSCAATLERGEVARHAIFACYADAEALCAGVAPGGGRIVACLQSQREAVSPLCQGALDDAIDAFAP